MLLKASAHLLMKFRYMLSVPCLFVNCGDPCVAAECLNQVRSKPLDQHEPLTRHIFENYEKDIEQVRDAHIVSELLQALIDALRSTPIDESPAEGYHRMTHVFKKRGSCSRLPYVMASTLFEQNMKLVEWFTKENNTLGSKVVRFEFQNHKRVLQVSHEHRYRNVRMKDDAFYKRLYNIDQAPVDFSAFVDGCEHTDKSAKPNATTSVRIEYLTKALRRNLHYSLPGKETEVDASGGASTVPIS